MIFTNPITWHCPYCKRHTQFNQEFKKQFTYQIALSDAWQCADMLVYSCVMCHEPVFFRVIGPSDQGDIPDDRITVYPRTIPDTPTDIPQPIRDIFLEAVRCASIQAWNAAATMCRRAVQECVVERGGEGRDLYHQIEDLAQKRIITEQLKEWAHEVRIIGKAGAHADVPIDVTSADADDALRFTDELLNYIYVLTARLQRRRGQVAKAVS